MSWFEWRRPLGLPQCPYAYRWMLDFGICSFRIHYWVASDDLRAKHNHPFSFITFVLRGEYWDIGEKKTERMSPGTVRYRHHSHSHSVKITKAPCVTLLVTGPTWHNWGFFHDGKFLRHEKYFKKVGHHECE